MAKVHGIDLGTTYSAIATLNDNGMPEVIINQDESSNTLASAVYFQEGSDPVVGEIAKGQKDIEPERVVEFAKRFIGKKDAPTYEFDGVTYDPITISALILKRIKAYAEAQGHDVKDVVITCPAYFGHEERAATKQAGIIAGLNVLNIVNEPTAAALNYCCREFKENRKIMVYDLGGGTFDITLFDFSVDDNGKSLIDIIDTDGNDRLGGIDWDARMFDYICEEYAADNGVDASELEIELQHKIKAMVEQAKKDLSMLPRKSFTINYDGDRTRVELTREEFENRCQDKVEQTMDFVRHLLEKTGTAADEIDVVLLVGGSTKMPMIKDAVEAMFPGKVRVEEPDLAVAKGAALAAAIEWNEIVRKLSDDKSYEDISRETVDFDPILPINTEDTNLPTSQEEAKATELINIIGDRIQPGTLKDKLTLSVGPAIFVDSTSYMIDNLLFAGDEMPAEAEAVYGTRVDNQKEIKVKVFESASKDKHVLPSIDEKGYEQYTDPALRVRMIGDLSMKLPPNTPKDSPIRVVFESSAAGLKVTAVNLSNGESVETIITSTTNKTAEELSEEKARFASIETAGWLD